MLAIDTYLNDIKKISQRSSRHFSNKSHKPSEPTSTTGQQHQKFKDKMAARKDEDQPDFGVEQQEAEEEEEEDEILASNITHFNGGKKRFLLDDEDTDTESVKQEAPQSHVSRSGQGRLLYDLFLIQFAF